MSIDSSRSSEQRSSTIIDVVICTKDRPAELARCLEALASQTRRPERVLVIDGGRSAPASAPASARGAEVVTSEPGLTRQRNVALDLSEGDLVAFIDDDVKLEPHYLKAIVRWFGDHPKCVGVGGHIVSDPVRRLPSRLFRRIFGLADADGRLRSSGEANYLRHPTASTRVDVLSGSNMVFRREAIRGLRFDEQFEGYGYMEDVDFCLGASERGELWTIPEARLVHHETATARIPQRLFVQQVLVNGTRVYSKHRARFGLSPVAFARRVVGRSVAYLAIGCWRLSLEPVRGVAQGLRDIWMAFAHRNG